MKERVVEEYLVDRVKELDGCAEKFTSPARRHVPDRLCTFADGLVWFVEVKRPGGRLTSGQCRDHTRRRRMGFRVDVVSSLEEVDVLILEVKRALY